MVKGRIDRKDGSYYEGEFSGGRYSGDGKLYTKATDTTYIGHFSSGCKHGLGKETCKQYTYKGRFASDRFHYDGRLDMKNDDWSEGTFYLGKFIRGKCKRTEADGSVYEGEIVNSVYEGNGVLRYKDGSVYSGEFKDGKPSGQGELTKSAQSVESMSSDEKLDVEKKSSVKRTSKKAVNGNDAVNSTKTTSSGGKRAVGGSVDENTAAERKSAVGDKKKSVDPVDKAYAELEAAVKKAVDDALIQYDKVLNPKPALTGLPVTTPEIAARDARRNAESAKKAAARFEERSKEEHRYGGALPANAKAYDVYDDKFGKNNVYKGQLNYKNQPHGYGRMEYANGDVYEGELDSACCLGIGRFRGEDYAFTGEFSDSAFNGVGIKVYDDGDTFMGAFSDSVMKSGVHISPTRGLRYEGEFGRGLLRNGYGVLYVNDDELGFFFIGGHVIGTGYYKSRNEIFKGFYNSERKSGSGVIEYNDGARYEGQVVDYIPDGYGRFTDAQGNSVICGFVKGKPDGIRIVTPNGGKPKRV